MATRPEPKKLRAVRIRRTGNGSLINYNGNEFGAGAVGSHGALLRLILRKKMVILKVDPLTEEPARDKNGLCIRVRNAELCVCDSDGMTRTHTCFWQTTGRGQRAGRARHAHCRRDRSRGKRGGRSRRSTSLFADIDSALLLSQSFAGYHDNPTATKKKVLHDVLQKGDSYFRTGDLLRRDSDGLWYFADRLGDTFRWKSENVATTDVAAALGEVVGEANVYGVLGQSPSLSSTTWLIVLTGGGARNSTRSRWPCWVCRDPEIGGRGRLCDPLSARQQNPAALRAAALYPPRRLVSLASVTALANPIFRPPAHLFSLFASPFFCVQARANRHRQADESRPPERGRRPRRGRNRPGLLARPGLARVQAVQAGALGSSQGRQGQALRLTKMLFFSGLAMSSSRICQICIW